ncbi:OsmC family protein [Cupriavidus sp. L7L]|uniref:OsmC family protein n=1 Tax=Cupriavidus sp. L7L TaxID=2546443 RepID=UPI0010560659|nr:OsmC family protein [Cupriavidus sp. L7L]TDF62522.1 OsmC family peroxiredoxin [Cupriavidus sp. L7L]
MAEAHYRAKLIWSGGALGPTKSVESYSREFRAEIDGKPAMRGSADPAFHGDPALYDPEDLLLVALSSCHMLSYLAVCAHAGIAVLSYEDPAIGTLARKDGRVRFTDVLLQPKVVVEAGSDIEKARTLHQKAHDICVIVNSVNFPVRHEAEVAFAAGESLPSGRSE